MVHTASLAGAVSLRQPAIGELPQRSSERLLIELWHQLPVHILNHFCCHSSQRHPVLLLNRQLLPKLFAITICWDLVGGET